MRLFSRMQTIITVALAGAGVNVWSTGVALRRGDLIVILDEPQLCTGGIR